MGDNPEGTVFLRNSKQNTMYAVMVVVGIIGFLLGLAVGPGSSSLGIIAVVGIFMLATKSKPILSFHDKYLKIKLAPLAPLLIIAYKDIENVSIQGKKMVISVSGRPKPVVLALNSFNDGDHEELKGILQKIIATNKGQSKP